jgi:uncharacterized protein (DUF2249 family)
MDNKITTESTPARPDNIPAEKFFDVRGIPCSVKHGQILERWRNLKVSDFFVLVNDHDPIPLRYQFEAEFANAFTWEHLQKGPDVFEVKIAKLCEPWKEELPPSIR